MLINFIDFTTKKNAQINLIVESVIPSHDLFYAFIHIDQKDKMKNGEIISSSRIMLRKIDHLVLGQFTYQGQHTTCNLGMISSIGSKTFNPVLLSMESTGEFVSSLELETIVDEIYFDEGFLIDYGEYKALHELYELPQLTLKEFTSRVISRSIYAGNYSSYFKHNGEISTRDIDFKNAYPEHKYFQWLKDQDVNK